MTGLEINDELRRAGAYLGESGQQWLDELPGLVASIEAEWGIACGRALHGGNWAYIAEATTPDGGAAVLKLAIPPGIEGPMRFERRALEMMGGDPYAALLKFDDARHALLLERLGRPLGELGWPTDRQISVSVETVARGWRPVTRDGLTTGEAHAAWLGDFIARTWDELRRPCSEECITRALDYARNRERVVRAAAPVLVHGDAHPWNMLEAPGSAGGRAAEPRFRLVDPEGSASEPAHDLGVILRGWNEELLDTDAAAVAFERCEAVGAITGVDCQNTWEWSYIERVSSGLVLLSLGREGEARAYLEVSDRLAGVKTPWA